jgi:CheY-like chemotaxis protein
VLVVEDEWLIREDIAHQLRAEGWRVLEASTAEGAIDVASTERCIDILVTDIQLAGYLSGWDLAETMRKTRPKIPVVYASGNAVDKSRAVDRSVFLSKPCQVTDIVNLCHKLSRE